MIIWVVCEINQNVKQYVFSYNRMSWSAVELESQAGSYFHLCTVCRRFCPIHKQGSRPSVDEEGLESIDRAWGPMTNQHLPV